MNKVETCKAHSGIQQAIDELTKAQNKTEKAVGEIRKRPPVWASSLISVLSFLLGCSVTYISMV